VLQRTVARSFILTQQPTSRVRCNIAFGELALNVSGDYVDKTVAVLIDILRDVHFIDFEQTMSWTGALLVLPLIYNTPPNYRSL
jgi:phosphatidylinositol 4-kinase